MKELNNFPSKAYTKCSRFTKKKKTPQPQNQHTNQEPQVMNYEDVLKAHR